VSTTAHNHQASCQPWAMSTKGIMNTRIWNTLNTHPRRHNICNLACNLAITNMSILLKRHIHRTWDTNLKFTRLYSDHEILMNRSLAPWSSKLPSLFSTFQELLFFRAKALPSTPFLNFLSGWTFIICWIPLAIFHAPCTHSFSRSLNKMGRQWFWFCYRLDGLLFL